MGVSTDALLVYGYVWEDEADLLPGEADEWEEIALRQRGVLSPWDTFPREIDQMLYDERRAARDAWTAEHRSELDAWYDAKKAIAAEFGVDIDRHGSDQWSCPIVKIAAAGKRAARGYPQTLTAAELAIDGDWDAKLVAFCETLGINTSEAQGPGWFLVSYWG